MVLSYIITSPNICNTWNICFAFVYKMYLLQPQPYKLQKLLCLQRATAGSALMQQSHMQNRDQGLVGQANAMKRWEPPCFIVLRLTGTCSIKHQTLLFPFEVHTSLENPVLYITFFFSFAFTLLFIQMNSLEPYLQDSVFMTQTSLFSFRDGLQSRHTRVVSSSKSWYFYDFTKP